MIGCIGLLGISAALVAVVGCETKARYATLMEQSPVVAVGSIGNDLYQDHCASCHGSTGAGDGIAAIALDVTPRDFWNEPFRYVSTLDGIPTREDIALSIRSGRLHGQMPAGPWLSSAEVDALAEYVLELNRLGWLVRLTEEFGDDEDMTAEELQEISYERVTTEEPITISMPSSDFRFNTEEARLLYLQSCASCHGQAGRGDGLNMPLDELGRPIAVRDLVTEPIQGGADPIELFKRIRSGLPGTPMPGQPALSDEDVWKLVYYTRHLMGRPLDR